MSKLELIEEIIPKTLSSIGEDVKHKVDCHKIFFKWREIVGEDAEKIFPVKIDGTTLTLYSSSPSLKDKFKYRIPQLIAKINSNIGEEVVTKINFGKTFLSNNQKVVEEKISADVEVAEVTLTDEEISDCEKKSSVIQDPERRKMLFDCLIAKKKSDKAKKFSDWHKCAVCENLCPPKENLCDICKITEQNKMIKAIQKIFSDAPSTKFFDVQKKIFELMPHMRPKCTLNLIESARMTLIQQTVSRLSFKDRESTLAKFFVMLVRQLPEESLTEKIIEKTFHEFRFDFADRPPLKPRNFKKFSSH
ncbi:MAG: DUF721 domain-containing protein [Selenomonadaceae bacterium]|nr:DUF721 domain-containing protein [Selenomonadaceae bacterium]